MATIGGYGTWKSPISSRMTTESGVQLQILYVDSDPNFSDKVYWNETHFNEGGRYVVCSADKTGSTVEWTPKGFNARTRVHEYGGGDFFVYKGVVYFSNFSDQALYRQNSPDAQPEPVTDNSKALRYADARICPEKSRIISVCEDHEVIKEGAKEAKNTIVSIDMDKKTSATLREGADFYASPKVSPNGKKIAWIQWFHPNMPWDSTELWTADLSESGDELISGSEKMIIGGKDASGQDLSVIEPSWTADNELIYIGDQSNWWNLYHVTNDGEHVNLHPVDSEIGGPQWMFGRTSYVIEPNGGSRIITSFGGELGVLDMKSKAYRAIDTGFAVHAKLAWLGNGSVFCTAGSGTQFPHVIRVDLETSKVDIIRRSMSAPVTSEYFSVPQKISWSTGNGETSHGLYYPPANKDFRAPEGETPPLLVRAHGGPTGAFLISLDLKLQYFTSRGFAVICVDYRGSTGYGKLYRHRLREQWGILDVEDCSSAISHLASKSLADPERVCISGGSAGGFTTLACLVFTDKFKAGVSHYGVSDLKALMSDTHKFESRYLDNLLAPLDNGGEKICEERSPINHVDKLDTALAFFQGDEDKIVLPNQAQMMYDAVKAKGLPTMLVIFEGEQHGFRKAENIQTALDGEFYFFGKVLGFEPADKHIKLSIDNI